MKQLNCTVGGRATDTPYLTIDNGHTYQGQFESPSRVLFVMPDTEPDDGNSWGLTIFYGGKAVRFLVPEFPGAYEGPLLQYAPALGRFEMDGYRLRANGKPAVWAMMTGFCDYKLFLDGGVGAIAPQLQQARDLGCQGRRVLGMMAYVTTFLPQSYGSRFYDALPDFANVLASYGQRLHFDVFADAQVVMPNRDQQLAHWARTCDKLRPIESVVIGAGNEWPKNGFDPDSLPYPGVLSSQGSTTSDAAPPMPGWGIRCWHGRRDYPKVYMSADDMIYVALGIREGQGQYAPVGPAVHDEPIGFAEVDIPGRRSTDPRLAEAMALTGMAFGAGATFHVESGIFSRLLGPTESRCAQAFFAALRPGV